MWDLFRRLRLIGTVLVVFYFLLMGISLFSVVLSVFILGTWCIHQCRASRPKGFVTHIYVRSGSTVGVFKGGRVDSTLHRCRRLGIHFVPKSTAAVSGFFCTEHAEEERQFRRR